MPTPIDTFVEKMHDVLRVVDGSNYRPGVYKYFEENLRGFLGTVNSLHPSDAVELLDMCVAAKRGWPLPGADEIFTLEKAWCEAIARSGTLQWKFWYPKLELQFTPKHSDQYFTLEFCPQNGVPLGLPLDVRLEVYADMDLEENHSDECPVYHGWSDMDGRFRETADDCHCEAQVAWVATHTFGEEAAGGLDEFKELLRDWITVALAGGDDEP